MTNKPEHKLWQTLIGKVKSVYFSPIVRMIADLLLVLVCYMVCRLAFMAENSDVFHGSLSFEAFIRIMRGGLMFDTSAILYSNVLFLLIVLLPLHLKEHRGVAIATKWIFVVVNALFIIVNLADSVYFQYTQQRTNIMVFSQFSNENNLLRITAIEMINHWYFVILAIVLIACLWKFYLNPITTEGITSLKRYYISKSIALVVLIPLILCGMRGAWFHSSTRPIAVANAHQYVDEPSQAGFVLNTTFSLLRTGAKKVVKIPEFYTDDNQLKAIYSPVHIPSDSAAVDNRNVVILIVESFAEEFIGARNRDLDNGTYKGYTPFVDSLLQHSLTFEHTYCNGWISIDAMPAVLASIPKVYNSFILSPYTLNNISSIATELASDGYTTAFFHGADNSSMGFQAFAKAAGFNRYFGRTEYKADPRFNGDDDFDGTWGIWDEEFLQFFALKMSELKQPFVSSVFTLSSHHPFKIPERYKDVFTDEGKYPMHKCIKYTDNALRQFFNTAKLQHWFNNTIFVITADHASSKTTHDIYKTDEGHFRVPIIIYDPSGKTPTGTLPGIMQHIDIMPTVLGLVNHDKPFFAFGKDMLATPPENSWAMNFHNIPQYIYQDHILQLDDNFNVSAVYNLKTDPLMENNIKGKQGTPEEYMYEHIKAILQTFDESMRENRVTAKSYTQPQ